MSDDQDDAPDIPPALSASEWTAFEAKRRNGELEISVAKYHDQPPKLYVWDRQVDPGASANVDDANDVAAMIALSNELLRRFDDPRAILRKHVILLRKAAEEIGNGDVETADERLPVERIAENGETYSQLHELADAIESYLPPEPQNAPR